MGEARARPFQQVDVFGSGPLTGNPLAVVLDGEGLSTDQMQRFARWTNLSESTFLLPPTDPAADYRVRIFTSARELPFAGHPTLGSCHAWLAAGGRPARPEVVVQQCGAGLVPIRRGERLAFAAPPLVRSGPVGEDTVDRLAEVLRVPRGQIVAAEWVDNGPGWLGVLLPDADSVLRLEPDLRGQAGADGGLDVGVVGPYPPGGECAYEVRALFRDQRGELGEDPVTGSLNASLAQWLLATGRVRAPYVASQGTRLGRRGRVFLTRDDDGTVWVGGATVSHLVGECRL